MYTCFLEKLSEVLPICPFANAWRRGAKFDLWDETFDFDRWQQAFAEHGLDVHQEAQRAFQPGQILPWAHLGGPDESYLLKHYRRALQQISPVF